MNETELEKAANRLTIAAAGVSLFYTGYKAYGIKGAIAATAIPLGLLWLMVDEPETSKQDSNA